MDATQEPRYCTPTYRAYAYSLLKMIMNTAGADSATERSHIDLDQPPAALISTWLRRRPARTASPASFAMSAIAARRCGAEFPNFVLVTSDIAARWRGADQREVAIARVKLRFSQIGHLPITSLVNETLIAWPPYVSRQTYKALMISQRPSKRPRWRYSSNGCDRTTTAAMSPATSTT